MTQVGSNQQSSDKTEPVVDNLIELSNDELNDSDNVVEKMNQMIISPPQIEHSKQETNTFEDLASNNKPSVICDGCTRLNDTLREQIEQNNKLEQQCFELSKRLEITKKDLEQEIQRRCELEQKFTEDSKRSTEQIGELINKSNHDDAKLNELRRKFEQYTREASSMIESFTTNREILTSQLLELRKENDILLGKYIGKSRDLQNEAIDLPQNIEDLQFHCLMLNEKLILTTLAKERLEETMVHHATLQTNETPFETI